MKKLTNKEARSVHDQLIRAATSIVEIKRASYSGGLDPFGNFRASEAVTGIPTWLGVIQRMVDKLSRIKNIADSGVTKTNLKDLSENDLADLINYTTILAGLLKELTLK